MSLDEKVSNIRNGIACWVRKTENASLSYDSSTIIVYQLFENLHVKDLNMTTVVCLKIVAS